MDKETPQTLFERRWALTVIERALAEVRKEWETASTAAEYYETFPASDANLEWALDPEADRMINAPVRKEILDTQITVVRNEMEAGENNPLNALAQRVMATAYLWHNYGKSTIDARSDVENVPIERLQVFYL